MRWIVALVAVVACSKKSKPPEPETYMTMTIEARCEATAPRAQLCVGAIIGAQLRSLVGSGSDVDEVARDMKPPTLNDPEVYRGMCPHSWIADAVVTCWDVDGCDAFAECVVKNDRPDLTTEPHWSQFASLNEKDKCEVTAKRAERCRDELAAERPLPPVPEKKIVRDEDSEPGGRKIRIELEEPKVEPSVPRPAYNHGEECKVPGHTKAIVECWKREPCREFARCVMG